MMTSRRWLLLLVLPLLFSATLGASPLTYLFPSRVMDKPIDFKHLDFECSREEDHAPKPTPEAETLFQKAYQTNLQAMAGDEPNAALLQQAIREYEVAAKAVHWKAIRNLALLYTSGISSGVGASRREVLAPDSTLAFRYARQLVKMNVASGYNLMAVYTAEGWGVRQDPQASLMFHRRAADLGDSSAQHQLGNKFTLEFNDLPREQVAQLEAIGAKMLACASRQGDREAAFDLATYYEATARNYPYALFYYHQSAKMGDMTSLHALYEWFRDGQYGYAPDKRRAERYYYYFRRRADEGEGPFPNLDTEIPLPPPPNGGSYPPPEMGWPNAWTKP